MVTRTFVLLASFIPLTACAEIAGVRDDLELVVADDDDAGSAEDASYGDAAEEASAAGEGGVDAGLRCAEGETVCGGACVDTLLDARHCGGCGAACGSNRVCVGGSCRQGGRDAGGG